MEKNVISVVVPVYNVYDLLEKCVNSISEQTFSETEIILVDDGSTDKSGELCDTLAEKDERIKVIHKQNGGLSDARNVGCDAAIGDYIIFIDSDDYIEKDMLEKLYNLAIENDAEVAVCGICDCYKDRRIPQSNEVLSFTASGTEALRLTLEGKRLPGSVCTKLIKRTVAQKLSFRVGKTYEDAFYTPDLFLSVNTVVATTESLYNYWHRSNSITTSPFSEKAMHAIEAYEYTLECVQKNCPELKDVAMFRIHWANFVVLDRMLATENYKQIQQFKTVLTHLKRNWLAIAKMGYFTKARRISAIALKISLSLYLKLSQLKGKREGIN